MQAPVGGLMATLVPHARIVPAVRPEDMSQDPLVVKHYLEVQITEWYNWLVVIELQGPNRASAGGQA